jgi:HPt (histidine-containing phosphotransfer) domain-containing protein
MSEGRDPAIDAMLAEARRQFASTLPAKVAELVALQGRGAWDELRRAAHKLRGSTGTYGFMDLSAAVGGVEEDILEAREQRGENVPAADVQRSIAARLKEATTAAERAAQ